MSAAVKRKRDQEPAPGHSILNSEDVAFPRGGSTVLTPLEIKQAASEATRDLLDAPKRKKSKGGSKQQGKPGSNASSTKVESLSFSRVVPGSIVLGQIVEINKYDMVLSLANNLLGYISLTRISGKLTELLEKSTAESDDEIDDEDTEQEKEEQGSEKDSTQEITTTLEELFHVGQWLRAVVVVDSSKDRKKHIDLSIDPILVNEQIQDDDLIPGIALQASVTSVEDHGVILDIGKPARSGFISKKELQLAEIDLQSLKPGSVQLLTIVSSKRTITLSALAQPKKISTVNGLSDIHSLLPGTLIDLLITEIRSNGIFGKVFGMIDATVDIVQSGALSFPKLQELYKEGMSIKARVLFLSPKEDKISVSLLPNILSLKGDDKPLDEYPVGHFVECKVLYVDSTSGLYVDIGASHTGFIHISRVSDKRIDDLSTMSQYNPGTMHKGRILGFSFADSLYIISTEQKILDQKYLSIWDVKIGEVVRGQVERILPKGGILVKLSDGLSALASENHLSDIKLVNPEKKFKLGMKVTGRILNIDFERSRIILTLKKTLVNSQDPPITSFESADVGLKTPGTIIAFKPRGVIVEYFGGVRGFLPVAEISEAYIKDPKDNFRLGQSVATRVLSVDSKQHRLIVSCRTSTSSEEEAAQFSTLQEGTVLKATIIEKTSNGIVATIAPHGVKGIIPMGLLADSSIKQALKGIKVGDEVDSVALIKDERKRIVTLTTKKSMVNDALKGCLPKTLTDFMVNDKLHGYVKNATLSGLFICFAGKFTALAPRPELSATKNIVDPSKEFEVYQSVECYVISVDSAKSRVVLSLKGKKATPSTSENFVPGDIAEAIVTSIKGTQLNVDIGKSQGRIDVSQLFDSIEDIKNVKDPLSSFSRHDKIQVRVIGYHDARHHQFLPISHRTASHIVLELSAKKSDLSDKYKPVTLQDTTIGSKWIGYVNNISSNCVFVNISPSLRGKISYLELSDNYEQLQNISNSFPIGSAVECMVIGIDSKSNFLILSARKVAGKSIACLDDITVGQIIPCIFIKKYPTNIVLSIGDSMMANCYITDVADEYLEDFNSKLALQDVLQAKILEVDVPNNKVNVTLRPSLIHGSSDVIDKYIGTVDDVKTSDVLKGYVKNVSSSGLFVSLGRSVVARVQIKELSDQFLSEWKKYFHVGQLVKGKVLSIVNGKIEFSLRESIVTGKEISVGSLYDLKEGDILDGTVKRIEDFGVFVRLGDTNLSGLCHRSQVADVPLSDITKVFAEGDKVKVKVLSVDPEKRRVSLGMKASYFVNDSDNEEEEDEEEDYDESSEVEIGNNEYIDDDSDEEISLDRHEKKSEIDMDLDASENSEEEEEGVSAGGFDWTASILDQMKQESDDSDSDLDAEDIGRAKKRRKRSKVVEDTTASLSTRLPQSVADYERLLVGMPNSSILWMNYMAFQLQLSEVDKAREIAKRALKTISFREESERLNIWIALLNLENSFGTDESLDEVFKDAIQYADAKTIHLKLVQIFIQSEKHRKAEDLYKIIAKKYGDDPRVWISYATFMMDQDSNLARSLLDRALSALKQRDHREVITKFAQLEYNKGDIERGRTLFEGLISSYPRRIDLWIVYIDCEIKHKQYKIAESLFERVIKVKLSMKQAKFFFKKWLSFETHYGDTKSSDYVKAKAAEYVSSRTEDGNE